MALHLTPAMLEATYDLLLKTPPFKRWGLPKAEEIEFRIEGNKGRMGAARYEKGKHIIFMSTHYIGRLSALTETMAHEMIHVHDDMLRIKSHHGPKFKRKADLVCRHHEFDRKRF